MRNSVNRQIRDAKHRYYATKFKYGVGVVSSKQTIPRSNSDDFANYLSDVDLITVDTSPLNLSSYSHANVQLHIYELTPRTTFYFDLVTELDVYFL